MSEVVPRPTGDAPPKWRPLEAIDRRVLGVLVEKAKTTPEAYPMSVNALRAGCNQKNNRHPLMELEAEDVEESLERLRAAGAAAEVQGGGRVPRFRHYLYEWLGVDKAELAVMAELLLRGAQTEGELRGRAARMEPLPDLAALRPILASLKHKGLVVSLTPEGRGHVVTHALYLDREWDKVRGEFAGAAAPAGAEPPRVPVSISETPAPRPLGPRPSASSAPPSTPVRSGADSQQAAIDALRAELSEVREELAAVRKDLDELWANFR
jgi:uncharacterized protein YceH (UPF0502 family)